MVVDNVWRHCWQVMTGHGGGRHRLWGRVSLSLVGRSPVTVTTNFVGLGRTPLCLCLSVGQ